MARGTTSLVAASKAIDPALDALFASSSGPVKPNSAAHYSRPPPKSKKAPTTEEEDTTSDEGSSEPDATSQHEQDDILDEEDVVDNGDAFQPDGSQGGVISIKERDATQRSRPERKRKRVAEADDLESKYLAKLAEADADPPAEKKHKTHKTPSAEAGRDGADPSPEGDASSEENAAEDNAQDQLDTESESDSDVPMHETLAADSTTSTELDKANCTVFVSNVSIEAITSKTAKKTLLSHLGSLLDASAGERILSLRFRSVALSAGGLPKKAAFITKSLMGATTKSTHAYVVYSTPAAARTAAAKLNATQVLGRHIRVDSVAHPSAVDHRRCIFVGNLGFVDDETVLNMDRQSGETTERKRTKVPADVEEGLWRTFLQHAGKVESVRVVRDAKTRVGKGIAYVQFYDENSVEAALLVDGKKFPPLLPRPLRVTRAKNPRHTALAIEKAKKKDGAAKEKRQPGKYAPKATPEEQSLAGRAGKLLGKAGAAKERHKHKPSRDRVPRPQGRPAEGKPTIRSPEDIIFEGKRASANDGIAFGKKGMKGRIVSLPRGARRAKEWRKKEGK